MFSLIVTIISIALALALMGAVMYYGSNVNKAKNEAKATALVAQSQQIMAATTLYRASNNEQSPASLDVLVPNYMTSIPAGWTTVDGFVVSTPENPISDDACLAYNAKQQVVGIPSCSDEAYADKQVCCKADGT